jgi:hypothetical protein
MKVSGAPSDRPFPPSWLLSAALVLAMSGQGALALGNRGYLPGVTLLAAAFPFVWFYAWMTPTMPAFVGGSSESLPDGSLRNGEPYERWREVVTELSLVASAASAALAVFHSGNVWSGGLWVAGVLGFLLARCPSIGPRTTATRHLDTREVLLLVGLVVAGSFARLYQLDHYPSGMHGDEGEFGCAALQVIEGRRLQLFGTEIFYQHPNVYSFLQAATMRIFGDDVAGIRTLSGIAGSVTLPFFYLLARCMFGMSLAFIATTLFAFAPWHLSFSRMAMNDVLIPLFLTMGTYLLWRGVQSKRHWYYASAGVVFGFGLWADYNNKSMLLAATVIAVVAYLVGTLWRGERNISPRLATLLLGVAVVMFPVWMTATQQGLFLRFLDLARQRSLLTEPADPSDSSVPSKIAMVGRHAERSVLGFSHYPDSSPFAAGGRRPVFDPLTATFFWVGLAFAVWHWRAPSLGVLLVWWMVSVTTSLLTSQPPQAHRLLPSIVPAYLLASAGICLLGTAVRRSLGPIASAILGSVLLGVITVHNASWYFSPDATDASWRRHTAIGKLMRDWVAKRDLYFFGLPKVSAHYGSIRFAAHRAPVVDVDDGRETIPLRRVPERDVAFLFIPERAGDLDLVRQHYGCGSVKEWVDDVDGSVFLTTFVVSRSDLVHPGACMPQS